MEEKNVHGFRNADKCTDPVSCAKHSTDRFWAQDVPELPASRSVPRFFSPALWPVILAACVACVGFWAGLEWLFLGSLRQYAKQI